MNDPLTKPGQGRTPRDMADSSARLDGILAAGIILIVVAIVAVVLL